MSQRSFAALAVSSLFLLPAMPAMATPEETPSDSTVMNSGEMGLRAAVMAAQAHTSGQVLEAEPEREGGKRVYEVDIVHEGKITEVKIDAETGKVNKAETDDLENQIKLLFLSDKKLNALKNARVSLADAIMKAEAETQGKALEAQFERDNGLYGYAIELETADDERRMVTVNADTGAVQTK